MRRSSRLAVFVALAVASLAHSACGRIGYDELHAQVLLVDVLEDRLAGPADMDSPRDLDPGATGLSLREALVISNNGPGSDLIVFDRTRFSPDEPGTVVLSAPLPDVADDETILEAEGVALDAGALSGEAAIRITASGVRVRGLTIRNAPGVAISIAPGLTDVSLYDNTILEPGGRAIEVSECRGMSIKGNRIERPGSDLVYVADCTEVRVSYNFMIIGDKDANRGVHFARVTDSWITSNIIDPGSARLVDLLDSSRNEIAYNVLDRGHAGVVLEGDSHENLVYQNVIIGSVYDGVYVSGASTGNTVVHNTMLQCSSAFVDGAPDTVSGNNLATDDETLFVDPAPPAYDFALVEGSDAIDAGDDLGYDRWPDGPEDFLGAAPDLGAIESF